MTAARTPRLWRALGRAWNRSRATRGAIVASALWVVLVLSYAIGFFAGGGAAQPRGTAFLDGVFVAVALVLPVMLVWLAAWLAEELARQKAAIELLTEASTPLATAMAEAQAALESHARPLTPEDIRQAVAAALRGQLADVLGPLAQIRAAQSEMQAQLAELAARPVPSLATVAPPAAPRKAAPEETRQPDLPLIAAAAGGDERPEWPDLVRALDFPRDAEDRAGFQALETAVRHRNLAMMLQAAEDVLTLLSHEGVYMDDLQHAPGSAEAWRAFVAGRRGAEVASVGGIRDQGALETTRGLMKTDPIFRDTALFFLRRFDAVLAEFTEGATDAQILELAETRSGRAFMLLARTNGAFD